MDIVFVHGWGYGPDIWKTLLTQLEGVTPHCVDLGFIESSSSSPPCDIPDNALLIGHSLGVMWLLKHGPENPRGLISICGFDCFSRYAGLAGVKAMARHLQRSPFPLMQDFWRNCSTPEPYSAEALHTDKLAQGLGWLEKWDESEALQKYSCPVLPLAATKDRIVPGEMSTTIWKNYPLRWCETDSHVLPLSHSDWCVAQIKEFIKNEL